MIFSYTRQCKKRSNIAAVNSVTCMIWLLWHHVKTLYKPTIRPLCLCLRISATCTNPGGHSTLGYTPCATKKTILFSLAFTERPPFLPTFTQWPPVFRKFWHFWRNVEKFWPFWPWKPLFLMHFTERPPIFVRFVTQRPPFLTQSVTERPLHLRYLVALVRHFHMWVPPQVQTICDEIKQNESEVEKYDFWFFGIFY